MPPNNPMTEGEALARAQFETWAKSRGRSTNTWVETGEYSHYDTQRCWQAWQAALTAHTADSAGEGPQEKVRFYVLDGTWYDAADASPYVVRHGTPVYDENSIDTGARTSDSEAIKITLHVDRAGCEWFIVTSDEFPDSESEVTPSDDPALFAFLKTYTAPPAALPADALERLVEEMRRESTDDHPMQHRGIPTVHADIRRWADELAALIPKGADHEQR